MLIFPSTHFNVYLCEYLPRKIWFVSMELAVILDFRALAKVHIKPGVHTNDFATIHGRPVRIHTAPAEDNTSNQQSTPQALCAYGRGDRESWRNR